MFCFIFGFIYFHTHVELSLVLPFSFGWVFQSFAHYFHQSFICVFCFFPFSLVHFLELFTFFQSLYLLLSLTTPYPYYLSTNSYLVLSFPVLYVSFFESLFPCLCLLSISILISSFSCFLSVECRLLSTFCLFLF